MLFPFSFRARDQRMPAPGKDTGSDFLIGVNYWPADRGVWWWRDFEASRVAEDFITMEETGWTAVRLLLQWEDFQPGPRKVSTQALDHLVRVAEIAERNSMRILPTLFTCHMGGLNWLPPWMLWAREEKMRYPVFSSGRVRWNAPRNFYSEPEILEAQVLLVREVSGALQGHPALWAWDLANEPSRLLVPPNRGASRIWLQAMTEELRSRDETVPITLGMHAEDLWEPASLGPRELSHALDFLSVQSSSGACPFAEGGLDTKILPFLGIIARWLAGSKEVLMGALGVPTWPAEMPAEKLDRERKLGLVSEGEAQVYLERALEQILNAGMMGALVWCYADCVPVLWDEPPFALSPRERTFGIMQHDRTPKSAQPLFRTFKGLQRRPSPAQAPEWIDIRLEEYGQDPSGQIQRLYRRYREYASGAG